MKNRIRIVLGVSLIFATFLFAFIILKPQAQDRNQQQDDPPTPIQLGVISEKQKRNSKLFETPPNQSRKNLIGNLKKSPLGFTVLYPGDENLGIDSRFLPPLTEFIKRSTCEADIVLIGSVLGKSSQITEDLKAVFTDYEISVNSVIFKKSNLEGNILPSITVTRLGGSILIDKSRIDYIVKSQKRFKVGMTYLLFLNYLPHSDSYKTVNRESVFSINGDKIRRYNDTAPPYKDNNEDINFFINVIRESANHCS
jgi:hypothetical protein